MFKFAIFDLDGTLCDTLADIFEALTVIFNQNSLQPPSLDEARTLMGDGLKAFLNKATRMHGNFDCPPKVMDDFIAYYGENCTVKTSLYQGMPELITTLNANNIKCAVLSNKAIRHVKVILEHFKLTDEFILISGGDTFAEKKPSPLPILETLRLTGFDKKDTLMIGDSINDVASGAAAGVATCYCEYGYGESLAIKPDYIVSAPREILDLFMEKR